MKTTDYLGPVNTDFSYPLFGIEDFKEFEILKIDSIIPNQETLDQEHLKLKIKGKFLTLPHVLKYKGKNILIDGHHTVIAKKINGNKSVRCKIINF